MIYSDLFIRDNKRIPTLIGLFIVFFIIIFFISIMNGSAQSSKANTVTLKRVEITNISPYQVTVYWQTTEKDIEWIVFSGGVVLDDRDVGQVKGRYFNHYVTIKDLSPGSDYSYSIVNSAQSVINQGKFKTPTEAAPTTSLDPANGKILNINQTPLANAVVLLTVDDNTVLLSSLTKDTGEWLVPLNSFYDKKTLIGKTFSGEENATVEIISDNGQISTIVDKLKNLSSDNRAMTIGENKNNLGQETVLSASTTFNGSSAPVPEIVYPKQGALIPGSKPLMKGTALPGAEVFIVVQSKMVFSAHVTADKDGQWNYLLPEDLSLGSHTLTITTKDNQGNEVSRSVKFTVIDNGGFEGKVLGTATNEATITIGPSPTIITNNYNPSIPTEIPTTLVSPTNSPPVTGNFDILPVVSGFSLIVIGGGILLVF